MISMLLKYKCLLLKVLGRPPFPRFLDGYDYRAMKKVNLARRLAKESHISTAAAADQLDRIVTDILKRIRKGKAASMPGLGTFRAGRGHDFQFEGLLPAGGTSKSSKKAGT